jgi:hypothetical protein
MFPLTVILPLEGESWNALLSRAQSATGELLIVLSGADGNLSAGDAALLADRCNALALRARFATRERTVTRALRAKGLRVIDRVADLRSLMENHPGLPEALRVFSPKVWQQQIRSRLQTMGLLSLPKLRIWALIAVSGLLFLFVLFWLLPSAEIRIWPREDTVSQTANVWLVLSGSTLAIPPRVRTMELRVIRVEVTRSLTFDQISKDFVGESARGEMTVINATAENYSLRSETRVANNAGMVFRLLEPVNIASGEELTVRVQAADTDLYGEIIGERGNLPAGLRWDFLGLSPEERTKVYAENRAPLVGGRTSFRTVLHEEDLRAAQRQLEQELLATAKQLVEEEKALHNSQRKDSTLDILYYDELTSAEFHNLRLPREFLGEPVASVPIEGSLSYIAFAYDARNVLDLLYRELTEHVGEGKRLLSETVGLDRLVTHVIDYADDFSWIKLTVDLSGTEQYILDPLSAKGARFAQRVREVVTGLPAEDALRILRNLPEVDNADIRIWPPWSTTLPRIPSHITIEPLKRSSSVR